MNTKYAIKHSEMREGLQISKNYKLHYNITECSYYLYYRTSSSSVYVYPMGLIPCKFFEQMPFYHVINQFKQHNVWAVIRLDKII